MGPKGTSETLDIHEIEDQLFSMASQGVPWSPKAGCWLADGCQTDFKDIIQLFLNAFWFFGDDVKKRGVARWRSNYDPSNNTNYQTMSGSNATNLAFLVFKSWWKRHRSPQKKNKKNDSP